MPRKSTRRLAIADAAIEVLARVGARGLSHRSVDEAAGVPAGTTSNYFRTRKALLDAVATRLLDHQLAEVAELPVPHDLDGLVTLVAAIVRPGGESARSRHLARYELCLEGSRDPDFLPVLVEVRAAIIESLTRLVEAAGYQGNADELHAASSALNGLLFENLVFIDGHRKTEPMVRAILAAFLTETEREHL